MTLRLPPPLERPLPVAEEDGRLLLLDGEGLVAEAVPTTLELDVARARLARGKRKRPTNAMSASAARSSPSASRAASGPATASASTSALSPAATCRRPRGGRTRCRPRWSGRRSTARAPTRWAGRAAARSSWAGWRPRSCACRARTSSASSSRGRSGRRAASSRRAPRSSARTASCSLAPARRGSPRAQVTVCYGRACATAPPCPSNSLLQGVEDRIAGAAVQAVGREEGDADVTRPQ